MSCTRRIPYVYDSKGFIHKACECCGERRATEQWSMAICAFSIRPIKRWFAVCIECDIAFNRASLEFVNSPDTERLMAAYVKRKSKEYKQELKDKS